MRLILWLPRQIAEFFIHLLNFIYLVLDDLMGMLWSWYKKQEVKSHIRKYIRTTRKNRNKIMANALEIRRQDEEAYKFYASIVLDLDLEIAKLQVILEEN